MTIQPGVQMTRKTSQQTFGLTKEGRAVWAARGTLPLPLDYRRVLGAVEYGSHIEVIRSQLSRFTPEQVDQWIAEFQAKGLIQAAPAGRHCDLDELAREPKTAPIEPEDVAESESIYSLVDISLSRLGVYVATDRARWWPDSAKRPGETRALVLEDDPDQAAVAVRRIKAAGYQPQAVENVASLYGFLKDREPPDAIFLDVNLPDGDGFQVLQTLRRHPSYAFLPVVMLTARTELPDVVRGLVLGADAYVTKSYGPNTLDYVLRYVLRQEASGAQADTAH
jgi:CheY-like chemotaxis protein